MNKKINQKYFVKDYDVPFYDDSGNDYTLSHNSVVTISGNPELRLINICDIPNEIKVYPVKIESGIVNIPPYSQQNLRKKIPNIHDERVYDIVSGFIPVNEGESLKKF